MAKSHKILKPHFLKENLCSFVRINLYLSEIPANNSNLSITREE